MPTQVSHRLAAFAGSIAIVLIGCERPVTEMAHGPLATRSCSVATLGGCNLASAADTIDDLSPNDRFGLQIHIQPGRVQWDPILESQAGWVRVSFDWDLLQPDTLGMWNAGLMADMHQTIDSLTDQGVKILGRLGFAPPWARRCTKVGGVWKYLDDTTFAGCTNRSYAPTTDRFWPWAVFVATMVDSFPQVDHWAVWNEPNDRGFLNLVPTGPYIDHPDSIQQVYARLFSYAEAEIHSRGKKTVGPELGDGQYLTWFADFNARMGWATDIFSLHYYNDPDQLAAFVGAHASASAGYSPAKPIWITEFGVPDVGVSQDDTTQLQRVKTAYGAMLSNVQPRWDKTFFFQIGSTDTSSNSDARRWHSLIERYMYPGERKRPAYHCFRELALTSSSVGPACLISVPTARISGPDNVGECDNDWSAVTNIPNAHYQWRADGILVGTGPALAFRSSSTFNLSLRVWRTGIADLGDEVEITVSPGC